MSDRSKSTTLKIQVPEKLEPLLQPYRYKGAYGGRGGAKSHCFAEMLIMRCFQDTTRAACIREVQNSLKESVRQLLIDKIQSMGLGYFFDVLDTEIKGINGSLIIFKGMQSYNAENIKSLEGFHIAWVEEAQTLSAHSLKLLRPTIREEGSEIWFSWNPRHDNDAVDEFFRAGEPRSDAIAIEVNWNDNPWLPEVLKLEKDADYDADPEQAEHVWGGGYEVVSEGAYYARLLHALDKEGRIGDYPYNPKLPVNTAWDLGVDDYTAIWFLQDNGTEVFVIDFYETSGEGAQDIIKAALPELNPDIRESTASLLELGREQSFNYDLHFVPHDVQVREWGAGAKPRAVTLRELGMKRLRIGAATNPADRINAVRRLLPSCYFNDIGRVQQGLSRLRKYQRRRNESMKVWTTPLHDESSHAADAFGEFAINCRIAEPVERPKPKPDWHVKVKDGQMGSRLPSHKEIIDGYRRKQAYG